MGFKTAASRKAYFAKKKPGKLVARKQAPTWYLQDPSTGQMEGRDDDAKHPKGTIGRKDATKAQQDKYGYIWGRQPEKE
jgi:hypothetical protein